jgi:DNA-binding NarL/FixJ family response regulator
MPGPLVQTDWIGILEALYALEQPRDAWLFGVLRAAAPVLGRDEGIGGVLYDAARKGDLRLDVMQGFEVSPQWMRSGVEAHTNPQLAEDVRRGYRRILCASAHDYLPRETDAGEFSREGMQHNGIVDTYVINGANPSGIGFALYVFSRARIHFSESETALLQRIAAHLATAYRLRQRLDATDRFSVSDAEAILSATGRVEHAEPEAQSHRARASLTQAVQERELARKRSGSPSVSRALSTWRGLVESRWSLLECLDTDGKRFFTARENRPTALGQPVLSDRESQVVSLAALGRSNKIIAYELGLADSTVRVLLARAARKLGVRTRAELVSVVLDATAGSPG